MPRADRLGPGSRPRRRQTTPGDRLPANLGSEEEIIGGNGEDVIYGGDGDDFVAEMWNSGVPDKLYCGKGKDVYDADKKDFVSSSCEKKAKWRGVP